MANFVFHSIFQIHVQWKTRLFWQINCQFFWCKRILSKVFAWVQAASSILSTLQLVVCYLDVFLIDCLPLVCHSLEVIECFEFNWMSFVEASCQRISCNTVMSTHDTYLICYLLCSAWIFNRCHRYKRIDADADRRLPELSSEWIRRGFLFVKWNYRLHAKAHWKGLSIKMLHATQLGRLHSEYTKWERKRMRGRDACVKKTWSNDTLKCKMRWNIAFRLSNMRMKWFKAIWYRTHDCSVRHGLFVWKCKTIVCPPLEPIRF